MSNIRVEYRSGLRTLDSLDEGEVFDTDDCVWIKTRDYADSNQDNVFNLTTNNASYMALTQQVKPLSATLVIE